MHDDLRSLIPASNGFAKASVEDGNEDISSTNEGTNISKIVQDFEIEYVGMDDSAISNGRVSLSLLTKLSIAHCRVQTRIRAFYNAHNREKVQGRSRYQ